MKQSIPRIPLHRLLRQLSDLRPKTLESYHTLFTNLSRCFGRVPTLNELTPSLCAQFSDWLTDHVQPSTKATYLVKLSRLLKQAATSGLYPYNPADIKALRPPHQEPSDPRYLSLEEVLALEQHPCPHEETRRAFLFSVYTGLRLSDIETLTLEHILKQANQLYIVKPQVKTGKTVRVPLSKKALEILSEQGFCYKPRSPHSSNEHIFTLQSRTTIATDLRLWAQQAGLSSSITFHTARHTYATLYLQAGVDIYVISRLCGHSSVSVTQRYAHLVDPVYAEAAAKLDTLLLGSAEKDVK